MPVAERFLWAADILQIQPEDTLLEIGCGTGSLVEEIASRLTTGRVTAIDRSSAMIKMCLKRNAVPVATGNARLLNIEFADSNFKKAEFDKIAAFNVNFFWKNPALELEIIRKILRPGGSLYIFYQAPFEITDRTADPVIDSLTKHSFEISTVILKKMKPTSALCVQARAAGT